MSYSVYLKYEVADELTESDLKKIIQMIISIWDYPAWIPEKDVIPMAEIFLGEIIISCSRIVIARDRGEIIGVVIASIIANIRQKANSKIRKYKALKQMIATDKEGILENYLDTLILNEKLLIESNKIFPASLDLFILDEQYQGIGIGNKLYSIFIDYLAEKNIKFFFLFTDSSSNFQFYEKKGLFKIAEKKYHWSSNPKINEFYYLYEGEIK